MSGRPNLAVRILARLLRPVVLEALDMGRRHAPPRPWPEIIEIAGGGALFAGRPRRSASAADDEFPAAPATLLSAVTPGKPITVGGGGGSSWEECPRSSGRVWWAWP